MTMSHKHELLQSSFAETPECGSEVCTGHWSVAVLRCNLISWSENVRQMCKFGCLI